jgi:NAD(P)-dependent dehydrogenase (short-subunit alcohol dehydrogenase family)
MLMVCRNLFIVSTMNIKGEAALVTGASAGLGKEVARLLARRGARVVLVARGEEALARAVDEIRAEGGEAHALAFDVGEKEAIHRIAGAAAALVGSPTIVVHNASTLGPVPLLPLLETDCEDLERALAVNLVGPFRLTKALAGPMILAQKGTFVFVSSDCATNAYPTWGAYGASNFAVENSHGLRFVSFDPGEMDTKMHADAVPGADRATLQRPADVAARLVGMLEGTLEVAA